MVSIQSMIYNLFKSTNVFLFGPLTQMPQIRRNLCTIRKSPLLVFSRLFVAIQSNGHGSPGSVFLTFFPPGVLNWNLAVLWALCCRTKREKREEGNATCEPVAHQLTIAASCPGLTHFHTHETGSIAALITRAAWTNAARHLSLLWPLLLPGAIDLGHSLQIHWPALGLSLFGILLNLPLPYFSRPAACQGNGISLLRYHSYHSYNTFPSHLLLTHH